MEYPPVSVVMPVRNEERHLAESVRHVLGQDYPGEFELVLAVGPSADRTEQIARELAAAQPRLTVVPNPTGKIPAALNAAVRAARHDVIARIDGHALLPPGYLATAVATLTETGAADVGGVMAAEGVTTFQQAVAWAMTSRPGWARPRSTPAAARARWTASTSASTTARRSSRSAATTRGCSGPRTGS